jgi:putative DNA primase/helicase
MNFANQNTIEQLQALQVEGQYVELRAITKHGSRQLFMNGNIGEALSWADERATEGADVYVGINPRCQQKGKKDDVQLVTALYTDLDLKNQGIDEAIDELLNCELMPNRIVKSGRGLHAYWHIEPSTDKALWRKVNLAIKERFNHLHADAAVAGDEARILRLVPYPNTKSDAGPVERIWLTQIRYTLEYVAERFGVIERQDDEDTERVIFTADDSLKTTLLRRAIKMGEPGNRNNAGFWLACQLRDNRVDEHEAIALMEQLVDNTAYPGGSYDYTEARRTLKSAYSGQARAAWELPSSDTPAAQKNVRFSTHYTDAGNAENFAALFGEDVRFNRTAEKWVIWNNARWEYDDLGRVEQLANQTARAMLKNAADIDDDDKRKKAAAWALGTENLMRGRAMLIKAQSLPQIAVTVSTFDTHPMLAAVHNGTLDLDTCTLRESRRTDYITKQFGTAYDKNADCPRWKQFINEVFDNDATTIRYVQAAIGYSLTGDTREQCLFLLHGNGRNGKSTFLEVMSMLMGDYAEVTGFSTLDAGTKSEQSNDLAKLSGARFVTIVEADEDRRFNEAKVKSVTGQDTITCRFLHKEFFSFRPQFKIWLAMNHKPIIRDMSDGMWRRIKFIAFNQSFKGREDKTLSTKLRAELPGILNWALEGLRDWKTNGLIEPQKVTDAVNEYRLESDVVAQWIEDMCEIESKYTMVLEHGYMSYKVWSEARNDRPMTMQAWSRRMTERGYASVRTRINGKQVRVYNGIKTDLSLIAKY